MGFLIHYSSMYKTQNLRWFLSPLLTVQIFREIYNEMSIAMQQKMVIPSLFSRLLSITQNMSKTAAEPAAAERENPNICWREKTAVLAQKLSVGRICSNNAYQQ